MTGFAVLRYNEKVAEGEPLTTTKKRKKRKTKYRRKYYEKNLSTQKETEEQGTRFP